MLLVLLMLCSSLCAQKTPDLHTHRAAVAQLEQEMKSTSTEDMVKAKEKEDDSFWPQCKIWAGLCAVTFFGQWVGYALQDKRSDPTKFAHEQELLRQLRQYNELHKDPKPEHPTGIVVEPKGDPRDEKDDKRDN